MTRRDEFLRLAAEVGKEDAEDPSTAEPWPKWFQNVVFRFGRVFIPTLKRTDFQNHRERFEGYVLAFTSQLIDEAAKVDRSALPDGAIFDAIRAEFEQVTTAEAERVSKALSAAGRLPTHQAGQVFGAYADGVKKRTAKFALDRLADSQTAQICLFLLFARPLIEGRSVPTVTALWNHFIRIREAFPGQQDFFKQQPQARRSLEQHFRRICTADGVKLAGRGHPRTNTTDQERSR